MSTARRASGRTGLGPPDRAPRLWPKIMHNVMTGEGIEKQFNSRNMTADSISVSDGKGTFLMGMVSVDMAHVDQQCIHHDECKVEERWLLRFTLKFNGEPVRTLEFLSNEDARMGRLIREFSMPITKMTVVEHPK